MGNSFPSIRVIFHARGSVGTGDLEKIENLFLSRDTPSKRKVQESPKCSESIRAEGKI